MAAQSSHFNFRVLHFGNNQQNANVNFFGTSWRAPMVLIVLAVSPVVGSAAGIFVMLSRWWKRQSAVASRAVTHGRTSTNQHDMSTAQHHGI
jgi:hypothetical protein